LPAPVALIVQFGCSASSHLPAKNEQIIQAKLEASTFDSVEPVRRKYRRGRVWLETVVLLEGHSIDQSQCLEHGKNCVNSWRGYRNDEVPTGSKVLGTGRCERRLPVTGNMLEYRQHRDDVEGGTIGQVIGEQASYQRRSAQSGTCLDVWVDSDALSQIACPSEQNTVCTSNVQYPTTRRYPREGLIDAQPLNDPIEPSHRLSALQAKNAQEETAEDGLCAKDEQ
jgi:hypothetical protein